MSPNVYVCGFEPWRQKLNDEQCREIRTSRDNEEEHVAVCVLQVEAREAGYAHTTYGSAEAANADY